VIATSCTHNAKVVGSSPTLATNLFMVLNEHIGNCKVADVFEFSPYSALCAHRKLFTAVGQVPAAMLTGTTG
jgi:hypothetical protein